MILSIFKVALEMSSDTTDDTLILNYGELWHRIPKGLTVERTKFDAFVYRINDIIYLQDSPQFRDAFNKERTWEKLSD